jgi:DNA polymerase-3 subunit epsilon
MQINGKTLWSNLPLHVIDFEGSSRTGVIEYGVVTLFQNEIFSTSTKLHIARTNLSPQDTQCHGLRDQDLVKQGPFEDEWDYWISLRRTGLFVAHNATIESQLLRLTWPRPSVVPAWLEEGVQLAEWAPWIDSCRLARLWMPSLGDYKLASLIKIFKLQAHLDHLAERYCPQGRRKYHSALYDALASALVLRTLCASGGRSQSTLSQLVQDSLSLPAHEESIQGEFDL